MKTLNYIIPVILCKNYPNLLRLLCLAYLGFFIQINAPSIKNIRRLFNRSSGRFIEKITGSRKIAETFARPRNIVLLNPNQPRNFERGSVIYAPWGVNAEGKRLHIYSGRSIKAESQPASAKFRGFMNITDANLQTTKHKDLVPFNKAINHLIAILDSLKINIKNPEQNSKAIKKELILAQYFLKLIYQIDNQPKTNKFLKLVHSFDQIVANCRDNKVLDKNLVHILEYLEKYKLWISGDNLEPDQIYELIELLVYSGTLVNGGSFALNINCDKENKPVFKTYSGWNFPQSSLKIKRSS